MKYQSELVLYDQETGVFTWKPRTIEMFSRDGDCIVWNKRFANKPAGTICAWGYVVISFNGKKVKAHQLAHFIVHGYVPSYIDHINGDRSDNKIANLRGATLSDNSANRGMDRRNKSGVKGVFWHDKAQKWQVQVVKFMKSHYGGLFCTLEEAKSARDALAKTLHGEYASDGVRNAA